MKKGLLILLCLPMIGLGQVLTESKEYSPRFINHFGGLVDDPQPRDFLHLFDGTITQLPDSAYGFVGISDPIFTLPVWEFMNTHLGTMLFSEIYANFGLGEITRTSTLDLNNQQETIIHNETGVNNTTTKDSIFYNSSGSYEKIIHREISVNIYKRKQFNYSGNNISEIYYFDTPNGLVPLQTDYVTYTSSNFVSEIQTGNSLFEYYYTSNDLLEYILYYHNGALIDTVGSYFYNNFLPDYCILKKYNLTTQLMEKVEKQEITYDSFNRFISEKTFSLDNNIWALDTEMTYIYYSNPTSIDEIFTKKQLICIKDLLGRETKGTKNEILFYIYDDGTVEKRIVIE
jgi:hypothetical protein